MPPAFSFVDAAKPVFDPVAWLAAQPTAGTREEWDAWWAEGVDPEKPAVRWTYCLKDGDSWLLSWFEDFEAGRTRETDRAGWLLDALIRDEGTEWLTASLPRSSKISGPTVWSSITTAWQPWVVKPGDEHARALFQRLLPLRLRLRQEPDRAEQENKPNPFHDLEILKWAYRLYAWPEAEEVERRGVSPDGVDQYCPMHTAGVAAWRRLDRQGWNLLEPVLDPEVSRVGARHSREVARWRRWLGPRDSFRTESNDAVYACVLPWARRHDPKGLDEWSRECAITLAREATTPERAAEAWEACEPWLPEILNQFVPLLQGSLWVGLLTSYPHLWASRLLPLTDNLEVRGAFAIGRIVSSASAYRDLSDMPEKERSAVVAVLRDRASTPPSRGMLFQFVPEHSERAMGWLQDHLPGDWLWGPPDPNWKLNVGLLGRPLEESAWIARRDGFIATARRHPPPPAFRWLVAACAAERSEHDLNEFLPEGATADGLTEWLSDASQTGGKLWLGTAAVGLLERRLLEGGLQPVAPARRRHRL